MMQFYKSEDIVQPELACQDQLTESVLVELHLKFKINSAPLFKLQ